MTQEQIKTKIEELDHWLQHNGGHQDYSKVLQDKNELLKKLENERTN